MNTQKKQTPEQISRKQEYLDAYALYMEKKREFEEAKAEYLRVCAEYAEYRKSEK